MDVHRLRLASIASLFGIVVLFLSACNLPIQSDPPGQNSGSAQNAQGAFNLDDPHAVSGVVGQTLSAYDVYTTVKTSITVTAATATTAAANQNPNESLLPPGEEFLMINFTVANLSTDSSACPNNHCTEYISSLSNFRLVDNQLRQWPSTTGAAESCQPLSLTCNSQRWLDEAKNGIPAGGSFSATINFLIPTNAHTFTFFYAPYRFSDTVADNGNSTGQSLATATGVATATAAPTPTSSSATPATTATAATGSGTPTTKTTATPAQVFGMPTLVKITIND